MEIKIKKFSAEWCSPCRAMKPEIEKLKKSHKEWAIEEIDIDKNKEEAEKYQIEAVPTLVITYKDKIERIEGFRTKEEIEKIVIEMSD